MISKRPSDASTTAAPAPAKFLLAVLVTQGFLLLSAHYRWFWFDELKGYTVVIAVAVTGALLLLLAGWLATRRLFGSKAQFSLASILLLILVIAIPCGWLTHELALTTKRRETLAAMDGNANYDDAIPKSPIPIDLHKRLRAALEKVLGDDFFSVRSRSRSMKLRMRLWKRSDP